MPTEVDDRSTEQLSVTERDATMPRPTDPTPPHGPGRDEFWGDQATWSDSPARPRNDERTASKSTGRESTARRWWDSLLGGGSSASRTHGISARARALDDDGLSAPDLDDETAGGDSVTEWDDGWDIEPTPPPRSGVDPLLARFGMLAVVITLSVPVVMGFTSGDDADQISSVASVADGVTTTIAAASTSVAPPVDVTPVDPVSDVTPTTTPTTTAATTAIDASTTMVSEASSSTANTAAPAELRVPAADPCGAEYELAAGDYWIRIADAAGVRLAELLAVNNATVDTVLVPGRSICLPVGARTPSPPSPSSTAKPAPSTTPASSAAPVTTARPTTTAPPAPTVAPTTTTKPRPTAVTAAEAEAIIRSVWPDELEDHALEIAWRESKYQSNAKNSCCYGLFQIHWSAHQSWLRGIGITAADQLYDATTNARAAYTLYQRSGGFGPWGG